MLAGLIALAVGVGFLNTGSKEILNARQSVGWIKGQGVITESKIVSKRKTGTRARESQERSQAEFWARGRSIRVSSGNSDNESKNET